MNSRFWFFLFFPLTLIFACKKVDYKTAIVQKYEQYKSVHFYLKEAYSYSYQEDTTKTNYEVWLVRDAKDTLRGLFLQINNYYRPYFMFYQNRDFYVAIPPKKTMLLYENFNFPFIEENDWIDFFAKTDKFLSDTSIIFGDTILKAKKHLLVKISRDGKSITYVLDKKTFLPVYSKLFLKTKDFSYVNEIQFTSAEVNNVERDTILKRFENFIKKYPIEKRSSELSILEAMLMEGEKAPDFEGVYFKNDEKFRFSDFVGDKILIVDFWYTHCPPCVKAIPYLSDLQEKYSDEILIFGLNSVDNQHKNLETLKKFVSKRNFSYDIILIPPTVDMKYKVKAYPSLYVIDKEGKIVYKEVGFSETKLKKLENFIDSLIRQ